MTIQFSTKHDAGGERTDVLSHSESRYALVLTAGVGKTLAVPSGADIMLVAATADLWVQYGATATIPVADINDGTAPELNPGGRWISGLTTIGFASSSNAIVSVTFFRRGTP